MENTLNVDVKVGKSEQECILGNILQPIRIEKGPRHL